MSTPDTTATRGWQFVTNHTQVLLCIVRNPDVRLRDVAVEVGITERAAQRIVADLAQEGYVSIRRVGRRNVYEVAEGRSMRHRLARHREIGEFLSLMLRDLDLEQIDPRRARRPDDA